MLDAILKKAAGRLRWRRRRPQPLEGRRVLVTRAPGQAGALSDEIRALGGEPVEVPLIHIVPTRPGGSLDDAISNVVTYTWIVFTSVNGVEFFLRRMKERGGTVHSISAQKVACVGEATAAALYAHGRRADLVPERFHGLSLAAALISRTRPGQRVLLVRGDLARSDLPRALTAHGVVVHEAIAYHTRPAPRGAEQVRRLLAEGQLDAVTFLSPSAVEQFVQGLGEEAPALLGDTVVACIGLSTATAARDKGLVVHVVPQQATVPALVAALAAHFAPPRRRRFRL